MLSKHVIKCLEKKNLPLPTPHKYAVLIELIKIVIWEKDSSITISKCPFESIVLFVGTC
jgi:hypothetical protein